MIITALLLALIVTIYCVGRVKRCLDSISEISYILPHWMFTVWIACIALLLSPAIIDSLPDNMKWVGFVSIVGLLTVAASPYYRTENAVMHYAGGWICGLGFMVVVFMNAPYILLGWLLYLVGLYFRKLTECVFWMEIFAFGMLMVALLR